MKKLVLAVALCATLAGCNTGAVNSAGSVAVTAEKSFGDAQIVFKGLQQAALVCITTNVAVCAAHKDEIIALVDKGQAVETAGNALIQAGNTASIADETTALLAVVSGLQAFGLTSQGN